LADKLQSLDNYVFACRTVAAATTDQLFDESRRLCDLHLAVYVLRLVSPSHSYTYTRSQVEPEGNREEKALAEEITTAIGRPNCIRTLDTDDALRDAEVLDARSSFYRTVEEVGNGHVRTVHIGLVCARSFA
jgi:hypothetical protein